MPTPDERLQRAEPRTVGADGLVAALRAGGVRRQQSLGLCLTSRQAAFSDGQHAWLVDASDPALLAALVEQVERALGPRWVWWSSQGDAAALVAAGVRLSACWDLGAVHRLIRGGWGDEPAQVWAMVAGLDEESIPSSGQLDLLAMAPASSPGSGAVRLDPVPAGRPMVPADPMSVDPDASDDRDDRDDPDNPIGPDGHLRPGCWEPEWLSRRPIRAARWAELAVQVARRQLDLLHHAPGAGDPRTTARSESAAALLSVELGLVGLPLDVAEAERVIGGFIGPRPADDGERLARRRERDGRVLALGRGATADLRNPAQVRTLLADVGVTVPDTRSWRLEPFRELHPLVGALLQWRKAERMETTYGYAWLDRQVDGGRLRGRWHGSDGAAGRMTAQAGLHNLPAELRPAVRAPRGRVLVRADLGQIEPRVLAAVSGDPALATAAAEADLYLPVAERLRVDRPTAKIAVLAAMYGQTSGAAGEALKGMDASYPQAMAYLRAADESGRRGQAVTTYGGRRVPVWPTPPGLDEDQARAVAAARGRFTRNAVIQGAAAELFKAWAATVRLTVADLDAQIVLCLHDELLVEAPLAAADAVAAELLRSLRATAELWFGSSRVRFVADIRAVERWSDAKD